MGRLRQAPEAKQAELEAEFAMLKAAMGFVPNSVRIMAHNPAIVRGFMALMAPVMGPGATIDRGLRQMIAHVASAAAGCRYCQAHTAEGAEHSGVSAAKIEALWSYETSDLFTEAERAALSLAQAAGSVPNQAKDAHFGALKDHFSEAEIAEIVAIVSVFGFLNRWNDTLATPLEETPLAFAEAHLSQRGWTVGAHGAA